MASDAGVLECIFKIPEEVGNRFHQLIANADRNNSYCYGLSWLDDIVGHTVKSSRVGHGSIIETQIFLENLLKQVPTIEFEGVLEHSFLTSEGPITSVEFKAKDGQLSWDEKYRCEYCYKRFFDADLLGEGPFYCRDCGIAEGLE